MSKERVEQVINQGIHRFLADGVIYRDLMDIRAALPDWSQWCAVWSRFAAAAEERGAQALKLSFTPHGGAGIRTCALYFHYAAESFLRRPEAQARDARSQGGCVHAGGARCSRRRWSR